MWKVVASALGLVRHLPAGSSDTQRISSRLQGGSDLGLTLGLTAGIVQRISSRLQANSNFVAQICRCA